MMLVSASMGAAATSGGMSETTLTGAFTRTGAGSCAMASRFINCGEGSADERVARAARMKEVYIMTVFIHGKRQSKDFG